jgi:hypothetical protein
MIGLLTLLSLIVLGVGTYGLFRGRVARLLIQSRKIAALVLVAGFVLLVIAGSIAPKVPGASEHDSKSDDCALWNRTDANQKVVRVAKFLKEGLKIEGNARPDPLNKENVRVAFMAITMQETDLHCKENIETSIDAALAQAAATMHTKLIFGNDPSAGRTKKLMSWSQHWCLILSRCRAAADMGQN